MCKLELRAYGYLLTIFILTMLFLKTFSAPLQHANIHFAQIIRNKNSTNPGIRVFESMTSMNIYTCLDNCKRRKLCDFVNFHFFTRTCSMVQELDHNKNEVVSNPYFIFGDKTEWNNTSCDVCSLEEVCMMDDNGTTNCTVNACPSPPTIADSTLLGNRYTIGSRLLYVCDVHYETSGGVPYITCQNDGTWSGTSMSCDPIGCINLPLTPKNGFLVGSSTNLGDRIDFGCDVGFLMTGSSSTTCLAGRVWSNGSPTCSTVTYVLYDYCVELPELCTNIPGSECVIYCVCRDGFIDDGTANCVEGCNLIPDNPEFGFRIDSSNYLGDIIRFACDMGFVMVGSSTTTCIANGVWSEASPTCRAAVLYDDCSSYPDLCTNIQNAECLSDGCFCSNGFIDDGAGNCVEGCSALPETPINGFLIGSSTYLDDIIEFGCNSTYVLVGSLSTTCLAYGIWDNVSPTCRTAILYDNCTGQLDLCRNIPQAECVSGECVCSEGYVDIGYGNCYQGCITLPETPINGSQTGSDTSMGGIITFGCNVGFVLVGSPSTTCLNTGLWENTPPTCRTAILYDNCNGSPDLCTNLPDAECVSGVCNCSDGYIDDGSGTCNVDGCSTLPETPTDGFLIGSGTKLGDSIGFYCSDGFVMEGSIATTCLANGAWDNASPICRAAILYDDCTGLPDFCTNIPGAECVSNQCFCSDGYVDDGNGNCVVVQFSCPSSRPSSYKTQILSDGQTFRYRVITSDEEQPTARQKCINNYNGKLVKIVTASKMEFLQQLLKCSVYGSRFDYWVDAQTDSSARWWTSDGQRLVMNDRYWFEGNSSSEEEDRCVRIQVENGQVKFNSNDCDNDYEYMCEK